MKIAHKYNEKTYLIDVCDWISINSGKIIGKTITEQVYVYCDYDVKGRRLSNKKAWQERTRNLTDNQFNKEY